MVRLEEVEVLAVLEALLMVEVLIHGLMELPVAVAVAVLETKAIGLEALEVVAEQAVELETTVQMQYLLLQILVLEAVVKPLTAVILQVQVVLEFV
jgi:hypothetical protein